MTAYGIIGRNKEWNRNRDLPGQRNTVRIIEVEEGNYSTEMLTTIDIL